jgi:hypothetical protein
MNRTTVIAVLALASLGTAAPARAGEHEHKAAPPPPELKILDRLDGQWKGEIEIKMGDKIAKGSCAVSCEKAAAGWALRCRLTMKEIAGMPAYEDVTVFGFDVAKREVHMYVVNNFGEAHDHKGTVQGDVITLEYRGEEKGQPLLERIEMDLRRAGHVGFKNTRSVAGQVVMVGKGTYRR